MNPTRIFTFAGLTLILLSFIPALMGRFWESIFLLAFVVAAGIGVIFRNLRR